MSLDCPSDQISPTAMVIKRSTKRKYLRLLIVIFLALTAILLLIGAAVFPYLTYWADQKTAPDAIKKLRAVGWLNTYQWVSIQIIVVLWVFAFGATIGSFLNVLVYRLPLGKSILGGSKCPFCAVPIKIYHNVPVFGWVWLGGRCRACRLPISIRYPIVELIAGLGFLYLFVTQLMFNAGAINTGEQISSNTQVVADVITAIFRSDLFDVIRCLWHCGLFSTLLTWGLIQWDRQPLPVSALLLSMFFGIAMTIAFPMLLPLDPISWLGENQSSFVQSCISVVVSLLLASTVSILIFVLGKVLIQKSTTGNIYIELQLLNLVAVCVTIAIWIGWGGMLVTVSCGLLIQLIVRRLNQSRQRSQNEADIVRVQVAGNRAMLLSMCFSTLLMSGFYRFFIDAKIWPTFDSPFWVGCIWLVVLLAAFCLVIASRFTKGDDSALENELSEQVNPIESSTSSKDVF